MRIALTGGIASGKSTVADMLAARGAVIIDSDVLSREVVEPGTEGWEAIRRRFGDQVIAADGFVDRRALSQIVFSDPDARADLETIIHPAVRERSAHYEDQAPTGAVVVHVIPLLVETGGADRFDQVVVVDIPVDLQVRRLQARNDLTEEEAWARISAQTSRERRLAAATHVIDNSGSVSSLEQQTQNLWDCLTG